MITKKLNVARLLESLHLSGLQVVVLLVSLLSQISLARYFGPGHELDAFYFAIGISSGVLGSISVGLNYVLPPKIVRCIVAGNEEGARLVAGQALAAVSALVLVMAALGVLVTAGIVDMIWDSAVAWSGLGLIALGWAAAGVAAVAAALGAISLAHRRVGVPLALSVFPPAFLVLALFMSVKPGPGHVLGGMLAGTIAQAGALAFYVRPHVRFDFSDREWWRVRGLWLAAFGAACFSGYAFVDSFVAPLVGSGVMTLQALAQRLVIAFGAVVSAGAFALAPADFGRMVESGDYPGAKRALHGAVSMLVGLCTVAALLTPWLARPVLEFLFAGGSFSRDDVKGLTAIVALLCFGAGAMLSSAICFRLLYALTSGGAVAVASLAWLFSYLALSLCLWQLAAPNPLALAYVLSWWWVFMALMLTLHRKLEPVVVHGR